jgi:Tfp pilus assembly protein PilN
VIRVNLLGVVPRAPRRAWLPADQKSAAAGLVMLVFTAAGVGGWWYQTAHAQAAVDTEIASAQTELERLKTVAALVDRSVARKLELTERLGLIDRLHRTQRDPVELLQTISRSVPDGLWLLELKQTGQAVQIEGRATSLTALTDFVERLQTSGRFARPVDIVTTNMEVVQDASVVRFALKASAQ